MKTVLRAAAVALVAAAVFVILARGPVVAQLACSRTAASTSAANVQSAINAASSGEVVCVPAGTDTWSTGVTVAGKALTLQGAGIGTTTITDGTASGAMLGITAGPTNFVRVTAFTFVKGGDRSDGTISVDPIGNIATNTGVSFRIDHNRILIASASSTHFIVPTTVYGLIDHNTFDVTATSGSIGSIDPSGSNDGNDGGFTPWTRALTLGTDQAVYIEDNTFNYGSQSEDSIDAYGGARFVIRHNTFNNITVGFHGFDSGDRRAVFSWEIYSNTFTNNGSTRLRGATLRGGTGVVYNNVYGGSQLWDDITILIYRTSSCLDHSSWGACDGTNWQLGSTDYSAQAARTASTNGGVKFCSGNRDHLCTADLNCSSVGEGTCSTFEDGAGTGGYACRDQVGRTHGQVLSPLYVWGNSGAGNVGVGTYDGACIGSFPLSTYIQAGRDYYADGTTMPGYAAYTYPHPLQGGGASPTHQGRARVFRRGDQR